jgi:hypothetical protein
MPTYTASCRRVIHPTYSTVAAEIATATIHHRRCARAAELDPNMPMPSTTGSTHLATVSTAKNPSPTLAKALPPAVTHTIQSPLGARAPKTAATLPNQCARLLPLFIRNFQSAQPGFHAVLKQTHARIHFARARCDIRRRLGAPPRFRLARRGRQTVLRQNVAAPPLCAMRKLPAAPARSALRGVIRPLQFYTEACTPKDVFVNTAVRATRRQLAVHHNRWNAADV